MFPSCTGAAHYRIPKSWDTAIVCDNNPIHTDGEVEAPPPKWARPARLRQNINAPLRFGDFVAH